MTAVPFAIGGNVPNNNEPIMVGERGPELFVPHAAGRVVPNDNLQGMRSGPTFQIDARGASVEAVQRLEKMVVALNGAIEPRAVAAVGEARRRGIMR
jgi:hypothetical protein